MDNLTYFFQQNNTKISNAENRVLLLVTQGFTNESIAQKLFLAEKTVEHHIHNIYTKLELLGVDFTNKHKRVYTTYLYLNNSHKTAPPCLGNMV